MTGKRIYYATFAQFAAANQLNYEFLTDNESVNIDMDYEPEEDECIDLYEPTRLGIPRNIGGPLGLRHHLAVINKIARVTFLPRSGNRDKVRGGYWSVISHVMQGHKINIISLIMNQLAEYRLNFELILYFAPYIMSVIKSKTNFRGLCESKHKPFRPFKNDTQFLQRPLTPFPPDPAPEGNENANESDAAAMGGDANQEAMPPPPPTMQQQWVPPTGYFDPYFASM